MTALSADKSIRSYPDGPQTYPVEAEAVIYQGALLVVASADDSLATPATTATGLVCIGVAAHAVDATGAADGAKTVKVEAGRIGPFANSAAADEITADHVGKLVYLVDDQTLAATDNSAARSPAGVCWKVDTDGVYIEVGLANSIVGDHEQRIYALENP